jgi:hypothetical protein
VLRLFAHHESSAPGTGTGSGPPEPTRNDTPPRLAARLPELADAQHWLRRAERRHGWAATFDATAAATSICIDLRFTAAHQLMTRGTNASYSANAHGRRHRKTFCVSVPGVGTSS